MSLHKVWMTRDMAELIVDLLEDNFKRGEAGIEPSGEGAGYAMALREEFKMGEQEPIEYGKGVLFKDSILIAQTHKDDTLTNNFV